MLALDEGDLVAADQSVRTALAIDPSQVQEERWAIVFEQQQQRLAAESGPADTLSR